VLEDSYHMVTLDRERHLVAEQTRVFISKVAAGLGLSDDRAPTGPAALAA
jgi:hypothetical protein